MTRTTGRVAALRHAARARLRLRTRLRRVRDAWRRRVPRRLPRWVEPAPSPGGGGAGTATMLAGDRVVARVAGANPRGRQRHGPPLATGELALAAGAGGQRWEIVRTRDRVPVLAGQVGAALTGRQSAVLAELAAVRCPPPPAEVPAGAWAQVVAQLAMTGVVLYAPSPSPSPSAAGGHLARELTEVLTEPLPDEHADPVSWELRSVRQRRAALRQHAAELAGPDRPPSVTALLVTKRPRLLPTVVAALAGQTYPELEILVGVHGSAPPAGLATAGRRLRMVTVPGTRNLGEALAELTDLADGAIVTKVDDDDRYGPEHIWDLVLASRYSAATVVGKGAEFVYLEPKNLTVRRRMAAENFTDTVAGGTIALGRAELAALGGWPAVPRSVDRALLDRAIAAGGSVYRTHPVGFIYTRHAEGHTWDPGLDYFLRDPVRTWPGLPPYPEFGTGPVAAT